MIALTLSIAYFILRYGAEIIYPLSCSLKAVHSDDTVERR